jgi:plasmid stability protein
VATIQIRDIPDEVHEELQRRAREAGQSLQAFMQQWVVQGTRDRLRRAAVLEELEQIMRKDGGTGVTRQQILDDLDAVRGR